MGIKINISPILYQYTSDRSTAEVDGDTVGQCLDHLVEQFPGIEKALFNKNGKLLNYVDIYVNEESAYPEELAKPVKAGDELHIVLTIAGG
ncbi:MoaD/ThiS family protein [Chloroflexota bacterium]